jgi:endonuclease G
MISQHQLVGDMLLEAFTPTTFQVPVRKITELSHLFAWDPMNVVSMAHPKARQALAIPALTLARELRTFDDLRL